MGRAPGGTVLKFKRMTSNADVYYTRFQNAYTSIPDTNNPTAVDYVAAGDSVTKGFEGELNFYVARGLSLYVNGTVGKADYVNTGLWIANTPSDTEAFGLTYTQKHFDFGIFDKRVGDMWNDLSLSNGSVANQVIPINPFRITNVDVNYTLRNGSR